MREASDHSIAGAATVTRLPGWISHAPAERPEDVAFLSGACLALLHLVGADAAVPHALWRARLALTAAEAGVAHSGRREGAAGLRDAVHLLRPADHPGPAGAVFRDWLRAVARPLVAGHLVVPEAGQGGPVEVAATVLEAVLTETPRDMTGAVLLADAALARAAGWAHVVPVLGAGLKMPDLRLRDEALRIACHRAVVTATRAAVPLAGDLARRAARLRSVMPKLRAKGAEGAVELFLTRDAVAAGALPMLSDRAARRLCERFVELGVLRELTGRETFRLYGV